MFKYSWKVLFALLIIFLIFLLKAHYEDKKVYKHHHTAHDCPVCMNLEKTQSHDTIINTINYENKYGKLAESKVKKLLVSSRDNIIRCILLGILEGDAIIALQTAIVWSLTGGIVTGIGDSLSWNTKF